MPARSRRRPCGWSSSSTEPLPSASIDPTTAAYAAVVASGVIARKPASAPGGVTPVSAYAPTARGQPAPGSNMPGTPASSTRIGSPVGGDREAQPEQHRAGRRERRRLDVQRQVVRGEPAHPALARAVPRARSPR